MRRLILYTTDGCHLCEVGAALLRSMPELSRTPIVEIDVATNDELVRRYGARIPVVACGARECAWPFNADDIPALLAP